MGSGSEEYLYFTVNEGGVYDQALELCKRHQLEVHLAGCAYDLVARLWETCDVATADEHVAAGSELDFSTDAIEAPQQTPERLANTPTNVKELVIGSCPERLYFDERYERLSRLAGT